MTLFCGADWASKWLKAVSSQADADIGIILTRESALVGQIEASRDEVRGIVSSYIADPRDNLAGSVKMGWGIGASVEAGGSVTATFNLCKF